MGDHDLNEYIGQIGLYQWLVFVTVFVIYVFSADPIAIIFIGADMPHWCYVPELAGLPYDIQKNVAIPAESINSNGSIAMYSSCEMFSLNYSVYNRSELYNWNRSVMIANDTPVASCSQWTYDQSQFISTVVSKFASTSFMAGFLVGSILCGIVSDRFGRKKAVVFFFVVKLVGLAMSTFGPIYTVFVIGRFVIGCGLIGYYLTCFILVMELLGAGYRPLLGAGLQFGFSVGFMLQPAFALGLRDQFWYQVAVSAPNLVLFLLAIVLLPESPRWLATNGKYVELIKLLRKICKMNGKELSEEFDPTSFTGQGRPAATTNCSALLVSPVMRIRTLIINFSWFTCSLIYYALAFNTGMLHGDIYLNTFLSGLLEIPAYIFAILLMNCKLTGRRWTGCLSHVSAGLASFGCIPLIQYGFGSATTLMSLLGKTAICATYSAAYVFSTELFPTELRSVGIGTASMSSRVSGMAAPYAGGPLASVWRPLPSLIFGVFSTLSGLLYVFLPETLGQVMPDTVLEVENSTRLSINEPTTT